MTNDMIYNQLLEQVNQQPLLRNGTRELFNYPNISFDPMDHLTRAKKAYREAEIAWYKTLHCNINGHPKIEDNPVWKKCAADDGSINSNYGWCIWSEGNCFQFKNAVNALLEDDCTRQSCCIYTRPEIQQHHNDNIHAKHDFICTFCTHHFIRDCKLEYIVYMRSNDIEFGLPYDLYWHQNVYVEMYGALIQKYDNLKLGRIYWHASSLHKYESRN